MPAFTICTDRHTGQRYYATHLRGRMLTDHPILNKGTHFSRKEREDLGLLGLVSTDDSIPVEQQLVRVYGHFRAKKSNLDKYIYLRGLQGRNETLFYRLVVDHIDEILPIIYTPTVGEACQKYHEIYRRSRGLYVSYRDRESIEIMLDNLDQPDVKVIVVSDGERILGLGDQGVGGMGIPIGKTALYTACGGVHPAYCLPVILDVGTDNDERLHDPLYLGWRHSRIRGAEYVNFVDLFVAAVKKKYPHALLQWEDFAKTNARALLDRYRNQLCTFNDDIQGTAAIAVAGLAAAAKVAKIPFSDQRVVIVGAGSAGTGIADYICMEMVKEGRSLQDARDRIWLIDRNGVLLDTDKNLFPFQAPYAKNSALLHDWITSAREVPSLADVVKHVHPTTLIGVSSAARAFTKDIVQDMAEWVDRPIIFPLSNPDTKAEADPRDLIEWTSGRALVATGTRFSPVTWQGKVYKIGQCNNYYIFPGIGLAVVVFQLPRVTDTMLLAAALTLSEHSPAVRFDGDSLFPPATDAHALAKHIACVVAVEAMRAGLIPVCSEKKALERIEAEFWEPAYWPIR